MVGASPPPPPPALPPMWPRFDFGLDTIHCSALPWEVFSLSSLVFASHRKPHFGLCPGWFAFSSMGRVILSSQIYWHLGEVNDCFVFSRPCCWYDRFNFVFHQVESLKPRVFSPYLKVLAVPSKQAFCIIRLKSLATNAGVEKRVVWSPLWRQPVCVQRIMFYSFVKALIWMTWKMRTKMIQK